MRRGVGLRLVAASGTILLGHALCSCGPTETTCEENATCPAAGGGAGMDAGGAGGAAGTDGGGTGGTDGSAGTGGASEAGADASGDASADSDAPACNTGLSPSEASCLVDDAYGVFVSAAASDAGTATGSRSKPFLTIAEGLAAAKKGTLRVYACGTFTTPVTIDAALDGVRLYGGFDCTTWAYSAANRTVVKPAAAGVALKVTGVKALEISDFEFDALDAAKAGESSIGAIVDTSDGVTLTRVKLVAGKGADGAAGDDGGPGQNGPPVDPQQQGGLNASCSATSRPGGSWGGVPSSCASLGGAGGDAKLNSDGTAGSPGDPRANVTPGGTDNGGAKGGQNGTIGSPGDSGTSGAGALAPLAFTASGYTLPDPGAKGTDGFPGQGGGGGGASNAPFGSGCFGASGGAGGMGGCGGKPGTGGGSGGASVALFSWQSGVTLTGCTLISATGGAGGKGGNGGAGGTGQAGAVGGAAYTVDGGTSIGKGGDGGKGGNGGPGGAGAGGHGGPSFALVCAGTSAKQNSTTLQPGTGGAKGSGGSVPSAAGDGQTGLAAAEYKLP